MTDRTAINGNSFSPIGPVPIGWGLVRVVDITTKVGSGATPKGGDKVYLRKRISHALVRSQHVFDRRFESGGLAFITDDDAHGLRNAELRPGDILLNITGDGITFGRACLVPDSILPACVNQHVSIIRVDKSRCLPGFLVSYLTHPMVKEYIESFNAGGSRRAITKGHIESFEVPLPPLDTQQRISDILGALDDKIELNRRMNETLEAMARRLFKSWFIDFDPVHAKAALRREHPKLSNADLSRRALPSMAPEIAELFPDSFEDSTLGPIPKGWKAGSLLETAELLSGGTPKTSEPGYWDGTVPWASAKDVSQCGETFLILTERSITEAGLLNSSTKLIDPFSTVIVARGATTGRMTMFGHAIAMNQTCYALRSRCQCPFHLYCNTRHSIDGLVQTAHGSVFDTITTRTFETSSVLIAPAQMARAFEEQVTPLFRSILRKQRETLDLSFVRNKLLPRLLSGDLQALLAGALT